MSRSRLKSPHENNRRSTNRPRETRNKELTRENETNFEPALNQSKQVQTEFLILTKPLKFDLNAVTKQTYFVRDRFPG